MAEILYNDYAHLTDGERATADKLRGLPPEWSVICNKVLVSRTGTMTREVDFIVIGDNTVLAIDEKSWSGEITGSDVMWKRANGDSERSPLNKVEMVSKHLAGEIRRKALSRDTLAEPFVYGCVSLTRQESQPQIKDPRSPRFVLLFSDLIGRILAIDEEFGATEVGKNRRAINNCLFDLRDRPKRPEEVNEYKVQQGYDGLYGSQICRATHSEGMERFLTIFAVTPDDNESRNFYLQEFRVLQKLAETGVSPLVFDPFRWADDFLVVPSSIPKGVSLGSLPEPENATEMVSELKRSKAIFDSLAMIHEQGIIHRMIGPDKIYIEEDKDRIKAVFTGFYAARNPNLEGHSIGPQLNKLNIDDPLVAPELEFGYEWAHSTSDTYSSSLMLLERFTGIPADRLKEKAAPLEIARTVPIWGLMSDVVVNSLMRFFTDTLGENPPNDSESNIEGRLSAVECSERLAEIIALT